MSVQETLRALAADKEAEAATWSTDPDSHEHYTADEMMAFSEAALDAQRDLNAAADLVDALEMNRTEGAEVIGDLRADKRHLLHELGRIADIAIGHESTTPALYRCGVIARRARERSS